MHLWNLRLTPKHLVINAALFHAAGRNDVVGYERLANLAGEQRVREDDGERGRGAAGGAVLGLVRGSVWARGHE